MIKILKEGKKPIKNKIVYSTTCSWCGCKFEFEGEDCKAMDRTPNGRVLIICPCCGNAISKRSNDLDYKEVEIKD